MLVIQSPVNTAPVNHAAWQHGCKELTDTTRSGAFDKRGIQSHHCDSCLVQYERNHRTGPMVLHLCNREVWDYARRIYV